MTVEETTPGNFTIKDVTLDQLEQIQSGLLEVEQHSLKAEEFADDRARCLQMFQEIDNTIIKHRS